MHQEVDAVHLRRRQLAEFHRADAWHDVKIDVLLILRECRAFSRMISIFIVRGQAPILNTRVRDVQTEPSRQSRDLLASWGASGLADVGRPPGRLMDCALSEPKTPRGARLT